MRIIYGGNFLVEKTNTYITSSGRAENLLRKIEPHLTSPDVAEAFFQASIASSSQSWGSELLKKGFRKPPLRTIKNAVQLSKGERDNFRKLMDTTIFFSFMVAHCLDINLDLFIEPVVDIGKTRQMDYAIGRAYVDVNRAEPKLIAEVKRIESTRTLKQELPDSLELLMEIAETYRCYGVLHIHALDEEVEKQVELLEAIHVLCDKVRVIVTSGKSFETFRTQLNEKMQQLLV